MERHEEVDRYAHRRRLNEASKHWAKRDHERWSEDEDEFLLSEWINVDADVRDEITVSQCLERTIESCRVRAEKVRRARGLMVFTVTTKTEVYIGHEDDPDDQWWSPGYYTRGR